jgi:hypothetical protein
MILSANSSSRLSQINYWLLPEFSFTLSGLPNFTVHPGTKDKCFFMTWIQTIPACDADPELQKAIDAQKLLYPKEYATPVHPTEEGGAQIVESHSLIPQALFHAFATFGSLLSPDLPLNRRQHEMIATMVSVANRCVY